MKNIENNKSAIYVSVIIHVIELSDLFVSIFHFPHN